MAKYKKCPRCGLNYILEEEEFCIVCKAELHIGDVKLLEDEDDDFLELCPVCRVNYISEDEVMCASCRKNKLKSVFADEDDENDEKWHAFLDEELPEEDEILIPLSEIAEEEEAWNEAEEFEDEENPPENDDEDDYEYVIDDLDDIDDEEEDDEKE
ncbi:MAG: hypothetical protein LBP79_05675 [Clostridiales bacterium]|jgi:hypothetical protein|nr:hypothetical protein [Clostridiales bacterium]